jgi:2-polyprenyl-6-methoxyphenol hydroxylase-like FAD-dependent oxidoreductase
MVVVVGAGIGGLGAALALDQRGHDVLVLERAKALEATGAGIALARNGLRALEQLGVGDQIASGGAKAGRVQLRTKEGDVLLEVPLHERGWEMLGTHRADLQAKLLDAVGPERIRLGTPCVGFEDDGGRVRVFLEDGETETADVLVGADGIRSLVRASLHGDDPPRYAGYVGWRTVIEFEHELLADVFTESWGCGGAVRPHPHRPWAHVLVRLRERARALRSAARVQKRIPPALRGLARPDSRGARGHRRRRSNRRDRDL